ncbi:MAG TPA: NADH:flavin oxidoreductase [Methanoregula sp.]|nr:NADH:flavin oxidoreductase [Methanoregula sp.]
MPVTPFDPFTINALTLKNRFVMAAAATLYSADEQGIITNEEIARINRISAGGIGLFINGAVTTHLSAQTRPRSCMITTDAGVLQFKKLTDTVHKNGTKIACQLCNSGIWAAAFQKTLGKEAIGASLVSDGAYAARTDFPDNFHAATEDEIAGIIRGFTSGAARVKTAGFDAVEIHAAHDSLLSQFLSPLSNRRNDRWGGSVENRSRIHAEVIRAVREAVGPDYPILVKLGVQDSIAGGLTQKDGIAAAQTCAGAGADMLEVSVGLAGADVMKESVLLGPITKIEQEAFTRESCRAVRRATGFPTIMTGGIRSLDLIEDILAAGDTDLVGLCRPFIREPALINRWKSGDRKKAACISCNMCLIRPKGHELACVIEDGDGEENSGKIQTS